MDSNAVSRRDFVAGSASLMLGAFAGAPMIVERHILGRGYQAPSDTLNIAFIGVGGMGMENWRAMLSQNTVALCDVDFAYVEKSLGEQLKPPGTIKAPPNVSTADAPAWVAKRTAEAQERYRNAQKMLDIYAKVPKYADYREMIDKQKDIDAVMIATPDHMHATIALAAMQMGKHVYVQKPLAYSVHETRLLAKAAANNPKLATQMGNQGHSGEGTHRVRELIAAGVLGKIHEVHVWTDRPVRYWAQGIPRPRPANAQVPTPNPRPQWNMGTVDNAVRAAMAANDTTPPPGLNWDLYLGAAPEIPYHPAYHPFAWRGWIDFGVGSIGDMGAHLMDAPFIALDLDFPTSITASSSPWGGGNQNPASYPMATFVQYEFPKRGKRDALKLYWYDGGLMPPRPDLLPDGEPMANPGSDGGGGVFIGEKGIMFYETYGNKPRIYPEKTAKKAEDVPKTLPRITTSHEMNWVQAAKGEAKASSPFSYAAPLTESMLLGIAALRAGQARKVRYDGSKMEFTNAPDANQYLTRVYRSGWELR